MCEKSFEVFRILAFKIFVKRLSLLFFSQASYKRDQGWDVCLFVFSMGVKMVRASGNISQNLTQLSCNALSFKDVGSFLVGGCPLPPRMEGKCLQLTKTFNFPGFGFVLFFFSWTEVGKPPFYRCWSQGFWIQMFSLLLFLKNF